MCGIAGFFSSQIEFKASDKYRNILYEMKKSLFHRGPDDSGIYLGSQGQLCDSAQKQRFRSMAGRLVPV